MADETRVMVPVCPPVNVTAGEVVLVLVLVTEYVMMNAMRNGDTSSAKRP